jgi:hypothetical protein
MTTLFGRGKISARLYHQTFDTLPKYLPPNIVITSVTAAILPPEMLGTAQSLMSMCLGPSSHPKTL